MTNVWSTDFLINSSSSPIYSLVLGTKTYVILSSDTAIKDLLDKRGANYSSRPELYVGMDIASGGLRLVFMVFLFIHTARTFQIVNVNELTRI